MLSGVVFTGYEDADTYSNTEDVLFEVEIAEAAWAFEDRETTYMVEGEHVLDFVTDLESDSNVVVLVARGSIEVFKRHNIERVTIKDASTKQ